MSNWDEVGSNVFQAVVIGFAAALIANRADLVTDTGDVVLFGLGAAVVVAILIVVGSAALVYWHHKAGRR